MTGALNQTAEERHEMIEAFVDELTPAVTNRTHAHNLWNHIASDAGPMRLALETIWAWSDSEDERAALAEDLFYADHRDDWGVANADERTEFYEAADRLIARRKVEVPGGVDQLVLVELKAEARHADENMRGVLMRAVAALETAGRTIATARAQARANLVGHAELEDERDRLAEQLAEAHAVIERARAIEPFTVSMRSDGSDAGETWVHQDELFAALTLPANALEAHDRMVVTSDDADAQLADTQLADVERVVRRLMPYRAGDQLLDALRAELFDDPQPQDPEASR